MASITLGTWQNVQCVNGCKGLQPMVKMSTVHGCTCQQKVPHYFPGKQALRSHVQAAEAACLEFRSDSC